MNEKDIEMLEDIKTWDYMKVDRIFDGYNIDEITDAFDIWLPLIELVREKYWKLKEDVK